MEFAPANTVRRRSSRALGLREEDSGLSSNLRPFGASTRILTGGSRRRSRRRTTLGLLALAAAYLVVYFLRRPSAARRATGVLNTWLRPRIKPAAQVAISDDINFGPGHSPSNEKRLNFAPRDLRIMFLNHHSGTLGELQAVMRAVSLRHNVSLTIKEDFGVSNLGRHITEELADEHWPVAAEQECNPDLYDLIIVGDTLPLIRPHLQNDCKLPMVAMLSTRFDWDLEGDTAWHKLVEHHSRRPNLRIIPNNLFEKRYASSKGLAIEMEPHIPSSGLPSEITYSNFQQSGLLMRQHSDHELVVPITVHTEECLLEPLNTLGIQYKSFPRNRHGGPLGLSDSLVVHIPYQSNVMGLFENLAQRVIYLIPTLSLYHRIIDCGAHISNTDPATFTDDEYRQYVDWWRPELAPLFYYFDDFEELRQGSALRSKILKEAEWKRAGIAAFMAQQAVKVVDRWEDVLFSTI